LECGFAPVGFANSAGESIAVDRHGTFWLGGGNVLISLERLYRWMPPWAQNVVVSGYGAFWKRQRLGGRFAEYVDEFRSRDRMSGADFRVLVASELARLLVIASQEVPYYQKTWPGAGDLAERTDGTTATQILQTLPITPKDALRGSPSDFVVRSRHGGRGLHQYASSGSSGTPVTVVWDSDVHRRFIAAREVRSFGWAGTSLLKSRSMIGGRSVVPETNSSPPFHRYNAAEKQVYFSAFHIAPQNLGHYIAAFNHHRPAVLTGYAHSYFTLARFMLDLNRKLDYQPDALVLSSEKVTDSMREILERAFGAPVFEEYGCVENCMLATQCEEGRLHVSPDFGIIEIVDDDGKILPPGHDGRIICTGLLNDIQPLIRYEVGDVGRLAVDPCPCGRDHLPVLEEVVGRLEDVIVGPDGRQMVRFHGVFVGIKGVLEGQVVQVSHQKIIVKVVVSGSFGLEEVGLIEGRVKDRLGAVEVEVERVPEIERTERGKFRAVVSEIREA